MLDWFFAFLATVGLELAIVAAGTRDLGLPLPRRLVVAFLAQVLTHPLVWFVFPKLPGDAEAWFWVSEIVAVLLEGVVYWRALGGIGALRAFALSALANGVSLGAGVAWNAFAR